MPSPVLKPMPDGLPKDGAPPAPVPGGTLSAYLYGGGPYSSRPPAEGLSPDSLCGGVAEVESVRSQPPAQIATPASVMQVNAARVVHLAVVQLRVMVVVMRSFTPVAHVIPQFPLER